MGRILGLSQGGRLLLPFEHRLIEAVQARLPSEAQSRLDEQVRRISKVQRLERGREVNLFSDLAEKCRFLNQRDEVLLASACLIHPETNKRLKAEVWLVKGWLFSLLFKQRPNDFFAGLSLSTVDPEVADVNVHIDPMEPEAPPTVGLAAPSSIGGFLRVWHDNGWIIRLYPTLPKPQRQRLVDCLDVRLPSDYLELTTFSDGVRLKECRVYGLRNLRKVVMADEAYYLLAEIDSVDVKGALAVQEGSRDCTIYFIDYEDESVRAMGDSVEGALVGLLKLA